MLTRIITAAVALALLIPVLIFSHTWVYPAAVALLCVIAVHEMTECIGVRKKYYISVPAELVAIACPLLARFFPQLCLPVIIVYCVWLAFTAVLFSRSTVVSSVSDAAFYTVYVIGGFTALVLTRDMQSKYYLLIFLAAWVTDSFAMISGVLFGKHKLCPKLSPKKTVEGAIGGTVGCVIGFTVFALIVHAPAAHYPAIILLGILSAAISMIGDLFASVIKRHFSVKDYGKIFPGHGGVLDRFDSILPLAYIALTVFTVMKL